MKVDLSGYPGNLTETELQACQKLRGELNKRKKDVANDERYTKRLFGYTKKWKQSPAPCVGFFGHDNLMSTESLR